MTQQRTPNPWRRCDGTGMKKCEGDSSFRLKYLYVFIIFVMASSGMTIHLFGVLGKVKALYPSSNGHIQLTAVHRKLQY